MERERLFPPQWIPTNVATPTEHGYYWIVGGRSKTLRIAYCMPAYGQELGTAPHWNDGPVKEHPTRYWSERIPEPPKE
jgi:hypothetical protein